MGLDEVKIDPNVLEFVRVLIQRYISKQQDLLKEYTSKMKRLGYDWDDQKGFGDMVQTVETVCKNGIESFEVISNVYRKFLWDEVLDIRKNLASIKK